MIELQPTSRHTAGTGAQNPRSEWEGDTGDLDRLDASVVDIRINEVERRLFGPVYEDAI